MKKFLVISEDTSEFNPTIDAQCDTMDEARAYIEERMLPYPKDKQYYVATPMLAAKVIPATINLVGFEPKPVPAPVGPATGDQ